MQHRSSDLEYNGPLKPQDSEEIHCQNGLRRCSNQRSDAGKSENLVKEFVLSRIDAVEDNGNVRQKFGDNIEGAYK